MQEHHWPRTWCIVQLAKTHAPLICTWSYVLSRWPIWRTACEHAFQLAFNIKVYMCLTWQILPGCWHYAATEEALQGSRVQRLDSEA